MGIICTGDLGFSWTLKLVLVAHLTRPDLAQGDYSFVFLLPLIEQRGIAFMGVWGTRLNIRFY